MRPDIVRNAVLPDYELPDHDGTLRKLSELQGSDPMILMLGRGSFCPKDRAQLAELVPFYEKIRVGFANLVTVTCDELRPLNGMRTGSGAHWTFLSDTGRTIQRYLGIQEYTDPENDPMIPHTFVLEPGLKVYKVYNGYWFWGRPSAAELWQDLRDVTRRVRPDWAIDTPDMRNKWDAGDKTSFWPYG